MPIGSQYRMDPEWVIFGVQHSGGVMIFASTELTRAEIEIEYDTPEFQFGPLRSAMDSKMRIELRIGMLSYVMATGETFQEAMARLFAEWNPDPTATTITSNEFEIQTKALKPGDPLSPW